jgi:hypothetical protein
MSIKQITVQRFSLVSRKPFEEVMAVITAAIGRPNMQLFQQEIAAAETEATLKELVQKAIGASDLMEFMRLDMGIVSRKRTGPIGLPRQTVRLIVGNPLIMTQMVERVPDAASYAPVTILVDERPDGVHVSYDRVASFLAAYEDEEALTIAEDLDAKVEKLLTAAAT